jgi:hypothetical protein
MPQLEYKLPFHVTHVKDGCETAIIFNYKNTFMVVACKLYKNS